MRGYKSLWASGRILVVLEVCPCRRRRYGKDAFVVRILTGARRGHDEVGLAIGDSLLTDFSGVEYLLCICDLVSVLVRLVGCRGECHGAVRFDGCAHKPLLIGSGGRVRHGTGAGLGNERVVQSECRLAFSLYEARIVV